MESLLFIFHCTHRHGLSASLVAQPRVRSEARPLPHLPGTDRAATEALHPELGSFRTLNPTRVCEAAAAPLAAWLTAHQPERLPFHFVFVCFYCTPGRFSMRAWVFEERLETCVSMLPGASEELADRLGHAPPVSVLGSLAILPLHT